MPVVVRLHDDAAVGLVERQHRAHDVVFQLEAFHRDRAGIDGLIPGDSALAIGAATLDAVQVGRVAGA